jgi:hypothetical protein
MEEQSNVKDYRVYKYAECRGVYLYEKAIFCKRERGEYACHPLSTNIVRWMLFWERIGSSERTLKRREGKMKLIEYVDVESMQIEAVIRGMKSN